MSDITTPQQRPSVSELPLSQHDRHALRQLLKDFSGHPQYGPLSAVLEKLLKEPQDLSLKDQSLLIGKEHALFRKLAQELALGKALLGDLIMRVVNWSEQVIEELSKKPHDAFVASTPEAIITTALYHPIDTKLTRLEDAVRLLDTPQKAGEDLTGKALNEVAAASDHKVKDEKKAEAEEVTEKKRVVDSTEAEMRAIDMQDGHENPDMPLIVAQLASPYGSREVALRQIREAQGREAADRKREKAA
jgi:hypothetical protein